MVTFKSRDVGNNTHVTHVTDRRTNDRKLNSGADRDTDFDPLLPADAAAIVNTAKALLLASGQGQIGLALKGKQLGLVCANEAQYGGGKGNPESSDADVFRLAATRLGARVAHIRPRLSAQSPTTELRRLALMLGRLYDAVECQGMSRDLVRRIEAQAGVPVFFRLASADHPTAALTGQLQGSASAHDKRVSILQASLLRSLERNS